MTYTIDNVELDHTDFDTLITITYHPSKFERFFGSKTRTVQYIGNCTVWQELPDFKFCSIETQKMLYQIEKKAEYAKRKKDNNSSYD